MFEKLLTLTDNVKKLAPDKVLVRVLFESEIRLFILDLNKQKQLFDKGITAEGNIAGYYSAFTEEITKGRKRAGDHYTFFDTGEFYRSFDVAVYSDGEFLIEANTIKEDGTDLQQKYRKEGNILGLTDESKSELIHKIYPAIIEQIRVDLYV